VAKPAARPGLIERQLERYGLLVYACHGNGGLVHQGWKDSDDSVFERDGRAAAPPIGLCEVQGYAIEALRGGAEFAELQGEEQRAQRWRERAERLRQHLEERFWVEEIGT